MVLYVDKKYQDSSYVFPDYKIDPEKKKEKQYAFKNTVAIYSTHLRGKSGVPFNQLDNWAKQRLYGIGDQDRGQYVTKLMGEDESNTTTLDLVPSTGEVFNTKEERRKGWENINKQIVSVASKIKDVYHGMFDEQDYNVSVDAIDENSGAAVEDAKLKLYANVLWAKELNKMRVNAELPDPAFSFAPKDLTELELYESAGGFKMNYAKAMEKLLKFSFSDGDW